MITRIRRGHGLWLPMAGHMRLNQQQHFSATSSLRSISPTPVRRPLEGVTVVSIEQAISAPYCTRQLADLGARVIKIERPGSGDFARDYDTRVDGLSSHFVWTNRSKESLALDLKKNKDLTTLKVLLGRADVFVQNLAPGAAGRLGLSHDDLHTENARLIVCDISGYGMDGPYKDKKAYDLLIQSEAGMLSVTGSPDSPAKVGVSIADIAAGMFAYSNILAALIQRNKTGKGQRIDISMLESMAEWMGFPMYYAYKNAPGPRPAGAAHAAIYPYGPFETGDGLTIMFGIQNEREWAAFCAKILAEQDLATDSRFCNNSLRVKNRDELRRLICKSLASLTAPEAVSRLDEAGIANANVNDMRGLWGHPQLRARDRWAEVDTAIGRVPALIPPGIPSVGSDMGGNVRMDGVPKVGEHNAAILAELGLKEE